MNIFERATKEKFRFSYRGSISVEDLWDMPVHELDNIFKSLNENLRACQGESLLSTKSNKSDVLEAKIEIIKHIVKVKLDESEARKHEAEKIAQKQKILAIIAEKQDSDLRDKSVEELQKMVDNL